MKARLVIILGFCLMTFGCFWLAGACAQSIDSTVYVKQFPGSTVGAKVTAAMATCGTNTTVKCYIVIDPSLAAAATGTIPSMCGHCILLDYRNGFPGASTPPPPFAVNLCGPQCNATCDGHTDDHAKVQMCLNTYPAVYIEQSGGGGTQINLGTVGIVLNTGNSIFGNGQYFAYAGSATAIDLSGGLSMNLNGILLDMSASTGTPTAVNFGTSVGFSSITSMADFEGPTGYTSLNVGSLDSVQNYTGSGNLINGGGIVSGADITGDITLNAGAFQYVNSGGNCFFDGDEINTLGVLCQANITFGEDVQPTFQYTIDVRQGGAGTVTWKAGGESAVYGRLTLAANSYAMTGAPTSGSLLLSKFDTPVYDSEFVTYPSVALVADCLGTANCVGGAARTSGTTYTNTTSVKLTEEVEMTSFLSPGATGGDSEIVGVAGTAGGAVNGVWNQCNGTASISFSVAPGETFSATATAIDGCAGQTNTITKWRETQ